MGEGAMTAAHQKIETPLWAIKPTFDRPVEARPMKSKFYHPVFYNVPCCLLIACVDSGFSCGYFPLAY